MMNKEISTLGRKLSNTTIQLHEAIASAAGLTGTDHKYLYLIVDYGPMTAGEFAEKARLTTGAVTGIIDRLEKQNLVKRVFDRSDRRKVHIEANARAVKDILSPLSAKLQERVNSLISSYTSSEQALISRYLNQSITLMQELTKEIYQSKKS